MNRPAITGLLIPAAASYMVASSRAAAVVIACLTVFCLPGIPGFKLLRLGKTVSPGLKWGGICITGYFISTCAGILMLTMFPGAHAAIILPLPIVMTLLLGLLERRFSDKASGKRTVNREPDPLNPRVHRSRTRHMLLILTLVMVLAAVIPPLFNIGKSYPEGLFFRAYFNVDYLKHVAVTAHLSHTEIPPDNPYLETDEPLHYYWFFYIFPGAVRALDIQGIETLDILRVLTIWGVIVFCLFLFGVCRELSGSPAAAFFAVFCGIFACSYEGVHLWRKIVESGESLFSGIGKYNVDAVTRWFIGHPQIDGLYRTLLFTPQHLFGLMLFGLSLITFCRHSGSGKQPAAGILWFIGLITGITFGFSSFIGIAGYIWLTVFACVLTIRHRNLRIGLHVALSLGLSILVMAALGILFRRPESLVFLPQSAVIRRLPAFLLLNFGPLILIFPAGLISGLRRHRFLAWNLLFLLLMCLFFILFIQIRNFPTDMGIKLGLIVNMVLILFVSMAFNTRSAKPHRILGLFACLAAIPAVPTLLFDAYNCSDTTNPRYSAIVEHEDIAACRWIRDHLPADVRIQSDPYERYEAYSLIPTFAERRTFVGDKMHARIFLSDPGVFEAADNQVDRLFRETQPEAAATILHDLGIDYVFVGRTERRKYPSSTDLFNNLVSIYRADGVSIHSRQLLASMNGLSFKNLPKPIPQKSDFELEPSSVPDPPAPSPESDSPAVRIAAEWSNPANSNPQLPNPSSAPYNLAVFAEVDSADPLTPHHFMMRRTLMLPDGTILQQSGNEVFGLELSESRRVNAGAFRISGEIQPGEYLVRLELYHVPDSGDSFMPTDYSVVDMHRRCHTTGIIEGCGKAEQVIARYPDQAPGIVARGHFGVLPPGDYTMTITSAGPGNPADDLHHIEMEITAGDRVFSEKIVAPQEDATVSMRFTLKHPGDTQVEIRLCEHGCLAVRSARLEWVALRPASAPLSMLEQRIIIGE